MKTTLKKILCRSLVAMFLIPAMARASRHDYGMFVADDAEVANKLHDKDAAILGTIYKCEKTRHVWNFHIKVDVCYKGNLRKGDHIFAWLEAEEGPDPAGEIGVRKYFVLSGVKKILPFGATVDKDVGAMFWCDWMDVLDYEKYGDKPGKAFLDAPKYEIVRLNAILTPVEVHEVNTKEDEEAYHNEPFRVESNCVFTMRWASRAELLARKRYWEKCLADHWIPRSVIPSEQCERVLFFDNSVCEYRQAVKPDHSGYDGPYSEDTVWRHLLPEEKGYTLYKKVVLDFIGASLAAPLAEPTEDSWCVMFSYVQGGKLMAGHFYVAYRTEIQALVSAMQKVGNDIHEPPSRDTAPADWMTKELKYMRAY